MLIVGNVREGKTLLMVYYAWKLTQLNRVVPESERLPIYANFTLRYPDVKKVSVSDLLDLEGLKTGLLLGDEIYTWLESRVSSSLLNRYCSYFLFQSGKRGVDVIATAQLGSSVDLRFFDLANIIVSAFKNEKDRRFEYEYLTRCGRGVRVSNYSLSFADAGLFWDDYDTGEPVAPLGLKELQFEMDKFDVEKINKRVDVVVERLLKESERFGWIDAGKVFRYQVEDWLLCVGEPLRLAPLVTNRLKCLFRARNITNA